MGEPKKPRVRDGRPLGPPDFHRAAFGGDRMVLYVTLTFRCGCALATQCATAEASLEISGTECLRCGELYVLDRRQLAKDMERHGKLTKLEKLALFGPGGCEVN